MSEYKITFEKSAVKFKAVSILPDGTDIKKLKGYDLYRMRIGNVRVIYSINKEVKIINIENIDNRGDIYKKY
ncbi:type II toxin-antitoxin system RelE/ParE family toxin [Muricomes sp. OA1]|uniref:Type II toxin-antitoxin system RelE/ParE family toxin n=1 Tax=Hungatella hathewayi TaxID=154046 RepID=A0A3E2WGK2_9FIRM|nr:MULTISPECIES: hypothetical protein [Clostridia]MCH1975303.1 type II toxin-antitoxin system RelE/ParE family toxin [Muricomes sp. OA1]RGC25799.1 type II toxin-antitoxin system RelE/ParE family toxin [Hungatella hathewayi]GKH34107.1 hypothetical protein CE91St64_35140 [Faecalicatena contorta]